MLPDTPEASVLTSSLQSGLPTPPLSPQHPYSTLPITGTFSLSGCHVNTWSVFKSHHHYHWSSSAQWTDRTPSHIHRLSAGCHGVPMVPSRSGPIFTHSVGGGGDTLFYPTGVHFLITAHSAICSPSALKAIFNSSCEPCFVKNWSWRALLKVSMTWVLFYGITGVEIKHRPVILTG